MINFNTYRQDEIEQKSVRAGFCPFDVMVAGNTGAGKSTTLNSFFQKTVATVGDGVDPETMELDAYRLNDVLRLWDTPGIGDGVKKDEIHKRKMVELLYKTYAFDNVSYGFIDLVLVIVEGAKRDMGSTYSLLNEVIVPNIQPERILVLINQADFAMKGMHWDASSCTPDISLIHYLEEKSCSIQRRVREATGVNILKPVYYSAKYGYNVQAAFDFIIDHMPTRRRSLNWKTS